MDIRFENSIEFMHAYESSIEFMHAYAGRSRTGSWAVVGKPGQRMDGMTHDMLTS